jgi:hypothetical protein
MAASLVVSQDDDWPSAVFACCDVIGIYYYGWIKGTPKPSRFNSTGVQPDTSFTIFHDVSLPFSHKILQSG